MWCKADRLVSEQRMKEIDEMRARGEKTELQLWWENTPTEKSHETRSKWTDEERAFLVQHKPFMSWGAIADALYKSEAACRKQMNTIIKNKKLTFYKKYRLPRLVRRFNFKCE